MSRMPRVVALGVPHHITQRGNGRQYILNNDVERRVYLDLLQRNAQLNSLEILGYCLMSNHVHLVAIPHQEDAMASALKHTHGRYAAYFNATHLSSGHVWQGRFYSCPLGPAHLWAALRYTELNPVRAGLAVRAEEWPWSSAGAHCGSRSPDVWLSMERWKSCWQPATWDEFLESGETADELIQLRRCTHTGRPLGETEFLREIEEQTQRSLRPGKGGRPRKQIAEQSVLGDPVEIW